MDVRWSLAQQHTPHTGPPALTHVRGASVSLHSHSLLCVGLSVLRRQRDKTPSSWTFSATLHADRCSPGCLPPRPYPRPHTSWIRAGSTFYVFSLTRVVAPRSPLASGRVRPCAGRVLTRKDCRSGLGIPGGVPERPCRCGRRPAGHGTCPCGRPAVRGSRPAPPTRHASGSVLQVGGWSTHLTHLRTSRTCARHAPAHLGVELTVPRARPVSQAAALGHLSEHTPPGPSPRSATPPPGPCPRSRCPCSRLCCAEPRPSVCPGPGAGPPTPPSPCLSVSDATSSVSTNAVCTPTISGFIRPAKL